MKLIAEHWGGDTYPDRRAEIFEDTQRGCFVVRYYKKRTIEELVDERDMITDGVAHSMRYAEDAAENYCLGYMALDGERSDK
jgi:hypothetical protein